MSRRTVISKIPVALNFPDEMSDAVEEVLNGEYESGYFGECLSILDIGANVGSFTLWANLRWPQSSIHAYEAQPETFKMLSQNVEHLSNITCYNLAIYPGEKRSELFWSRYAGDGEAGLVACVGNFISELAEENIVEVPVLHPRELPHADIIKIDVEGAEALILNHLNLQEASLILLEYHNIENRDAIKDLLQDTFTIEYEDRFKWDKLLPHYSYKKELKGNYFGRLFFANRRQNRLRKLNSEQWAAELSPGSEAQRISLWEILSILPAATKKALKRRVARFL